MRNGKANRNGHRNGHPAGVATGSKSRLAQSAPAETESRLPVLKTYKIFIGGKFPRTESGRFYLLKNPRTNQPIADMCLCTRKDFREAVVAARSAQGGWGAKSAYNRGQILYRIAEMLEGRAAQFVDEMVQMGIAETIARTEVSTSIDRLVYYAGWADKYQQVFSSVNPVASSHFNFSVLEPSGVVAVLAPQDSALIGLVSTIIPAITGGNTVIALASQNLPLCAVTLAEVLATSDLPGGVINILTGQRSELLEHFSGHMDVNTVIYCGTDDQERAAVRAKSAVNVKRAVCYDRADWLGSDAQNPYFILDSQETKTTWHPIGV
jgi:acyl-CoA reductase-like NAD-dependent aldehyde dehydrogenase